MSDVTGVRIFCIVGVYLLRAIVLVVVLAPVAGHAGPYLSTNTSSVTDLELSNFRTNSGNFAGLS